MRGYFVNVVRGQQIRRRRFARETAVFLFVVLFLALFHVWTRVQVVRTGYQIRNLREAREEMEGESHALRVEVATLRSPARLEKAALKAGLMRPPEKQVILITSRAP